MPQVTMTFTLPDEQGEFDAARLGPAALSALWDISQRCRVLMDHCNPTQNDFALAAEICEMIPSELLNV